MVGGEGEMVDMARDAHIIWNSFFISAYFLLLQSGLGRFT